MASGPYLVFVKGPQIGQRVMLHGDHVVAGRSAECHLQLTEHYASRQQVEFVHADQGWAAENLSSNGTLINGKRYRAGKEVLLSTGDVIGIGLETEMLFIAEGDDVQEALARHRQTEAPVAPSPLPAPKTDQLEKPSIPSGAKPPPTEPVVPLSEEQLQAQATKAKYKKYFILLGISGAITLAIALMSFLGGSDSATPADSGLPVRLSDEQIREAIEARPQVPHANPVLASDMLTRANALAQNHIRTGDLYNCIRYYKLYQAYNGTPVMDTVTESQYRSALYGKEGEDGLVKQVTREYEKAYEFERAQRWGEALTALERIVALVPEQDSSDPTYQQLLTNVFKHRSMVRAKIPTKK